MSKSSDAFLLSLIRLTRSDRLKWVWMFLISIGLAALKNSSLQFVFEPFFLGEAFGIFLIAYVITAIIYRLLTKPAGRQTSSFLGLFLFVGIFVVVVSGMQT